MGHGKLSSSKRGLAPTWRKIGLVDLNEEGRQIGGFVGPLLSFPRPPPLSRAIVRGERDGLPALPRGLGRRSRYQFVVSGRKLPKDNVAQTHRPELGRLGCAFHAG